MNRGIRNLNRRGFIAAASALTLEPWLLRAQSAIGPSRAPIPIFDGQTLKGWSQFENSSISFSPNSILDPVELGKRLQDRANPTSVFLYSSLSHAVKQQIAADQSGNADHKALSSALAKYFNEQVAAPALYAPGRFDLKAIRPETGELLAKNPRGVELMRLNKLLIEDAYPAQLAKSVSEGWIVKDGAMASTGSGRGVIYSTRDYARFRLIFTMRHVSGKPDHQACVLIFCTRPQPGEKPLDALGGIQFQVPNGGHWDYRPGMNQGGGAEFNNPQEPAFDIHSWSRVEILADASRGTARMAVAQPPGSKGIEVLDFHDPTAGKIGPIALQMHNAGLLDEYKDLVIDIDPADDELLSTRLPSGT